MSDVRSMQQYPTRACAHTVLLLAVRLPHVNRMCSRRGPKQHGEHDGESEAPEMTPDPREPRPRYAPVHCILPAFANPRHDLCAWPTSLSSGSSGWSARPVGAASAVPVSSAFLRREASASCCSYVVAIAYV